jgi:hypothetical protein
MVDLIPSKQGSNKNLDSFGGCQSNGHATSKVLNLCLEL